MDDEIRPPRRLRLDAQLAGDGEAVVAGIEEIDDAQRQPRLMTGDLARIIAAQHLQPGLVVADAGELAIGGLGRGRVDAINAHQRRDQMRPEQHLVVAVAQRGMLRRRQKAVAHGLEMLDRRALGEVPFRAVGHIGSYSAARGSASVTRLRQTRARSSSAPSRPRPATRSGCRWRRCRAAQGPGRTT